MRDKKLHPKLSIFIAVLLVLLTVSTAVVWYNQSRGDKSKTENTTSTSQSQQKADKSQPDVVSYRGQEGKNAMELLKAKAEVVTQQSSYGEYVDSINGVKGGTDGKYWAFYVNGQMAQVGAADYQTKNEDNIQWKFE